MPTEGTNSITYWLTALEKYSFEQLCIKPAEENWSLGQLYTHLINDTRFYMEQARTAIANDDNADESASSFAATLFSNNSFPDKRIAGDPSNAAIPQPENKQQLSTGLLHIKQDMESLAAIIAAGNYTGKTKHPGMGYFTAAQWLQFADMHFRHHYRQKKRIDDFLGKNED